MIFIDIMGGLGNQLFQIFTTLAYEIQTGSAAVFPFSTHLGESNNGTTVRNTYWETIFKQIKQKTTFDAPDYKKENEEKRKWNCFRENGFHYTAIPTDVRGDFQIYGYFQSWKYFHGYALRIIEDLKLYSLQQEVLSKYPEVRFPDDIKISMHFRLGDYKYKQEYHPVMPLDYYQFSLGNCLEELSERGIQRQQIIVLYFCEDEDAEFVMSERIEPLKKAFPTVRFYRVSSMTDWEQLLVMANSHHHIIANSSFSWWGAYLACNLLHSPRNQLTKTIEYPLVYFPSKWFGPAMSVSTEDLGLPYWNRVPVL